MLKTNCILLKKAEKSKSSDILVPGVIAYIQQIKKPAFSKEDRLDVFNILVALISLVDKDILYRTSIISVHYHDWLTCNTVE